jgi:hypothetical protein
MKYMPLIFTVLVFAVSVHAEPPDELEGMKRIKQWTDYENKSGEMPSFVWGDHDGADRVGIYVEFASGLKGSATYRDLTKADIWNKETGVNLPSAVRPETATGFFAADKNSPLHFLRNVPAYCGYKPVRSNCLPMAWSTLSMPLTNNFDLDYNNQRGSHLRLSQRGWNWAIIAVYAVPVKYVLKEDL